MSDTYNTESAESEASLLSESCSEVSEHSKAITRSEIFNRFIQLFMTGERLKRMMIYICNACTADIRDPITHTICLLLTSPIVLNITKTGLAPFRGSNTSVLPYSSMDKEQKEFLLECLDIMQSRDMAVLSTQMGGGGMATLVNEEKRYISQAEVLTQFCVAVNETSVLKKKIMKENLCNMVIQKVCSVVHIPRSTLSEVQAILNSA